MKKFLLSCLCLLTMAIPSLAADTFKLVKSIDELGDEADCIIVNTANKVAMSTTQNTNNRGQVSVEIAENETIVPGDKVEIVTIVKTPENTYQLKVNGGYLGCGTGKSDNHLKTFVDAQDATIEINATTNSATIKFTKRTDRNIVQYNSANNIFACYSSGQKDVQLYVKQSGEVTPPAPVYPTECEDPIFSFNGKGLLPQETEVEGYAGSKVSIACPTKDSTIEWSVAKGTETMDIEGYEYVIPEDAAVGDVYEFIAEASVQGETELIKSEIVMLTVTVIDKPNYIEDVLTAEKFGKPSNYNTVSTYTSTSTGIAYKAQMMTDNGNMQLRSKENSSAIVVTSNENGYILKKVEIEWADNTISGRIFKVYGSDKAFTAISEAYDEGLVELGLFEYTEGKPVVIETDNDFAYIAMRSAKDAMYIAKLTLYWEKPAVAPSAPTLLDSDDFTIENGMLNAEDGVKINFNAVDGIDIYYKLGSNVEQVQTKACTDEHEGYTMHDGNDITLSTIHSALTYFACDPATGLHSEPETLRLSINTGVAEIEIENGDAEYFNLQGARVANPENGLYIRVVNGKAQKVIVK